MHPNHPARAGPTGGPLGGIISYPPPSVQSRRAEKTPHAFVKSAQAAAAHVTNGPPGLRRHFLCCHPLPVLLLLFVFFRSFPVLLSSFLAPRLRRCSIPVFCRFPFGRFPFRPLPLFCRVRQCHFAAFCKVFFARCAFSRRTLCADEFFRKKALDNPPKACIIKAHG